MGLKGNEYMAIIVELDVKREFPTNYLNIPKINNKDTCFHYTSNTALISIINNETIRFTRLSDLNDKTEVIEGLDYFSNALKERNINDNLNKELVNEIQQNSFVFCCSFGGDSVAMWNYYCKNDNSYGFNIEFDYSKLINSILRNNFKHFEKSSIHYGNVAYDDVDKKEVVKDSIYKFEKSVEQFFNGLFHNESREIKQVLENDKRKFNNFKLTHKEDGIPFFKYQPFNEIYFLKNSSFEYEKEIRIVISFHNEQLEKLRNLGIIKKNTTGKIDKEYMDLSFSLDSIVAIKTCPEIDTDIFEKYLII